ncbi:hypothetical protein I3679_008540 [Proteus mirabilis]|uniref:Uncharacterized protein n=1 Tax=Proteus mirabilis TaxID=584 RepID=A0ABD5LS59_PROMI
MMIKRYIRFINNTPIMVVMASDVVVVKVNTEDNTTMAIMNIVVMVKGPSPRTSWRMLPTG